MVTRLVRICLAAFLTTALAGGGAAWAQDEEEGDGEGKSDKSDEESEEEDELGEDTNPCAGISPPCGDTGSGAVAGGRKRDRDREGDEGDDEEGGSKVARGEGEG